METMETAEQVLEHLREMKNTHSKMEVWREAQKIRNLNPILFGEVCKEIGLYDLWVLEQRVDKAVDTVMNS